MTPGSGDDITAGAMIQKVAFTIYPVKDPARARAFYEDTLGLKPGLKAPNGDWTEYDLPGGGCLALFRGPGEPSATAGGSIAFEVEDLNVLTHKLKADGVVFQAEGIRGPRCSMSVILDSEGNSIVLHQLDQKP